MDYTQDTFKQLFKTIRTKERLLNYLQENPNAFVPLVKSSLSNAPEAWRASWLVGHTMEINDIRIQSSVDIMIASLEQLKEGHQRQTIIILSKMCLNDAQEGKLFDSCLTIWEHLKSIPSTRITAMKFILKIGDKFPALKPEIKLWTQDIYLDSLSPGIKRSLIKRVKKITQ
jgi:hypothetical protein